jgi:hypothetical protein
LSDKKSTHTVNTNEEIKRVENMVAKIYSSSNKLRENNLINSSKIVSETNSISSSKKLRETNFTKMEQKNAHQNKSKIFEIKSSQ